MKNSRPKAFRSGKVVYKGKKFQLIIRKWRLPNKKIATSELIEHPGAVLIVPFLSKNKIIFLRQFRPVIKRHLYELPAGTLNAKEKPLECAKRELVEETSYRAGVFIRLGKIFPVPAYSTELITIYKAEHLIREQGTKDFDEIIETRIFTKTQVKKLFDRGMIMDGKTISGLAMCGWI